MDRDSKLINEAYGKGHTINGAFITELPHIPPEGIAVEGIGTIYRYGVWANIDGKPQVIETGSDLEALRHKYGIPPERFVTLK